MKVNVKRHRRKTRKGYVSVKRHVRKVSKRRNYGDFLDPIVPKSLERPSDITLADRASRAAAARAREDAKLERRIAARKFSTDGADFVPGRDFKLLEDPDTGEAVLLTSGNVAEAARSRKRRKDLMTGVTKYFRRKKRGDTFTSVRLPDNLETVRGVPVLRADELMITEPTVRLGKKGSKASFQFDIDDFPVEKETINSEEK